MNIFTKTSYRKSLIFLLTLAPSIIAPSIVRSQELAPEPIMTWYKSLKTNDANAIAGLLTDNAVIKLEDLGISQTKEEFIASLDQWAELNGDVNILTRTASVAGNKVEMKVCYRFTSNEVLNLETFELIETKIAKSVQKQLSKTCEDF